VKIFVLTLACKHAEPAIYATEFWHKLLFRRSALFHPRVSKTETFQAFEMACDRTFGFVSQEKRAIETSVEKKQMARHCCPAI